LSARPLPPPGSGSDCAGIIDDNGFTLKAFNPKRKFTETSAAAHTCMRSPIRISCPVRAAC
jgi:hypothetical protein